MSDGPTLPQEELITREEARARLAAWESNGLTEEMLRNHDGYLKLNRGVMLVSEHYLEELQAERDDTLKDGLVQAVTISNLQQQNTELLEDVAALRMEVDELKAKLERNVCNSGHTTLPLYLWDCPECHNQTRLDRDEARGAVRVLEDEVAKRNETIADLKYQVIEDTEE